MFLRNADGSLLPAKFFGVAILAPVLFRDEETGGCF
jgi:hypothetical protein